MGNEDCPHSPDWGAEHMAEEVTTCTATTWLGSDEEPPEKCDQDTLPGEEYCAEHFEDH